MTGKRVEAFVLARKLPKAMMETIWYLDWFFGKMETQQLEKDVEEAKKKAGATS